MLLTLCLKKQRTFSVVCKTQVEVLEFDGILFNRLNQIFEDESDTNQLERQHNKSLLREDILTKNIFTSQPSPSYSHTPSQSPSSSSYAYPRVQNKIIQGVPSLKNIRFANSSHRIPTETDQNNLIRSRRVSIDERDNLSDMSQRSSRQIVTPLNPLKLSNPIHFTTQCTNPSQNVIGYINMETIVSKQSLECTPKRDILSKNWMEKILLHSNVITPIKLPEESQGESRRVSMSQLSQNYMLSKQSRYKQPDNHHQLNLPLKFSIKSSLLLPSHMEICKNDSYAPSQYLQDESGDRASQTIENDNNISRLCIAPNNPTEFTRKEEDQCLTPTWDHSFIQFTENSDPPIETKDDLLKSKTRVENDQPKHLSCRYLPICKSMNNIGQNELSPDKFVDENQFQSERYHNDDKLDSQKTDSTQTQLKPVKTHLKSAEKIHFLRTLPKLNKIHMTKSIIKRIQPRIHSKIDLLAPPQESSHKKIIQSAQSPRGIKQSPSASILGDILPQMQRNRSLNENSFACPSKQRSRDNKVHTEQSPSQKPTIQRSKSLEKRPFDIQKYKQVLKRMQNPLIFFSQEQSVLKTEAIKKMKESPLKLAPTPICLLKKRSSDNTLMIEKFKNYFHQLKNNKKGFQTSTLTMPSNQLHLFQKESRYIQ